MSANTPKVDYLLLFRGTNWDKGLSPQQIQKVVADWYAWFERLKQEGWVRLDFPEEFAE